MNGNEKSEDKKKGSLNLDGLVLVVPFNSAADLLIMSLEEYQKFKRRGDITRENRKRKGLEDL